MSQKKTNRKKRILSYDAVIRREFRILLLVAIVIFVAVIAANVYAFRTFSTAANPTSTIFYVSTGLLLFAAVLVLTFLLLKKGGMEERVRAAVEGELGSLRAANKRAKSLQEMASTLRATLSFERVVDSALDVCSAVLAEMGVPARNFVGAVLLYEGDVLVPMADRGLGRDVKLRVAGERGIIADALQKAEPAITKEPRNDPEVSQFTGFRNCEVVIAVPLRVEFQIYGVMLIASKTPVVIEPEQLDMFIAVADQAVIALRNAQLYESLAKEKQRLIEADEEARKQLARDLHDGPTQSVAAIAMRINFVRSLLQHEPETAMSELEKVEELAKETGKDIRHMLFTLRPLVIEEQGLGAAVDQVLSRIREAEGPRMKLSLVGSEYGDLLSKRARGVVFAVIEEALGNARKYSGAEKIEVRFWQDKDLFVAQIKDDGVGFDVEDVMDGYSSRGSLGMVNMQERADMVDGSIKVESAPGKGTKITLIVPLDKHGNKAKV